MQQTQTISPTQQGTITASSEDLLRERILAEAEQEAFREYALEALRNGTTQPSCPHCFSDKCQWRGYRHNKNGQTKHRRSCNSCHTWFQANI